MARVSSTTHSVTWLTLCHQAQSHDWHYITKPTHMTNITSPSPVTWLTLYHQAQSHDWHYITKPSHMTDIIYPRSVTWHHQSKSHDIMSPNPVIWLALHHQAQSHDWHHITKPSYMTLHHSTHLSTIYIFSNLALLPFFSIWNVMILKLKL